MKQVQNRVELDDTTYDIARFEDDGGRTPDISSNHSQQDAFERNLPPPSLPCGDGRMMVPSDGWVNFAAIPN